MILVLSGLAALAALAVLFVLVPYLAVQLVMGRPRQGPRWQRPESAAPKKTQDAVVSVPEPPADIDWAALPYCPMCRQTPCSLIFAPHWRPVNPTPKLPALPDHKLPDDSLPF
jgi:hypothetical protein